MALIQHIIESHTTDQLPEGVPVETQAGDKKVCLLRKKDAIFAFAATCPHAGARLCEGWLNGSGNLVCPLHKYVFSVENGRNLTGEGYKLFRYPVEIRGTAIFVGILA